MFRQFVALVIGICLISSVVKAEKNAHSFGFMSIDGENLSLSEFKGKVLLIVNTASHCGFTSQYSALQSLWSQFRNRGLVVIGVPSNDFGNQEPGTVKEIKTFCEVNYDIDFPMPLQALGTELGPIWTLPWNCILLSAELSKIVQ